VVEGAGLEFQLHLHRCTWFESHPLRQFEQFERNAPFVGRFRSCRSSRAAVTRLAAVLPIAALALLACAPAPSPERIAGDTMGTTYEVVVTDRPAHVARDDLQSAVDAALVEINSHLSGWDPHSELARFNAATATDWIPVSMLLARAVSEAQSVTQASGGAFDVTVSPLVRAWGFGAGAVEDGAAPTPAEIEWLRESVGYRKLQSRLRPPALRKSVPTLHVDLDGIAPGIAVDRIADRLETHGIRDYLVELGGEVRARGRSPAGRPWRVAVEAPLTGQRQPYAIVELDRMGVSTSGDYRDYRELDGRRLSHTIDPRTAAPGGARARLGDRAASVDGSGGRLGHRPDGPRPGGGHGARAAPRPRGAVHRPRAGRFTGRVGDARVRALSPGGALSAMIRR
jgi:FAD:protein FMN transferase